MVVAVPKEPMVLHKKVLVVAIPEGILQEVVCLRMVPLQVVLVEVLVAVDVAVLLQEERTEGDVLLKQEVEKVP